MPCATLIKFHAAHSTSSFPTQRQGMVKRIWWPCWGVRGMLPAMFHFHLTVHGCSWFYHSMQYLKLICCWQNGKNNCYLCSRHIFLMNDDCQCFNGDIYIAFTGFWNKSYPCFASFTLSVWISRIGKCLLYISSNSIWEWYGCRKWTLTSQVDTHKIKSHWITCCTVSCQSLECR